MACAFVIPLWTTGMKQGADELSFSLEGFFGRHIELVAI